MKIPKVQNIHNPIKNDPKRAIASFASGFALGAGAFFLLGKRGSFRSGSAKDNRLDSFKDTYDRVAAVMTRNPVVCTPATDLSDVAIKMMEYDCGAIPVVENEESCTPIGIITDRDIVCRAVAARNNPLDLKVRDCMTVQTITVSEDASVEECCKLMEKNQVRRIPVVNAGGRCVGIVSQADIAIQASPKHATQVIREVSKPSLPMEVQATAAA